MHTMTVVINGDSLIPLQKYIKLAELPKEFGINFSNMFLNIFLRP